MCIITQASITYTYWNMGCRWTINVYFSVKHHEVKGKKRRTYKHKAVSQNLTVATLNYIIIQLWMQTGTTLEKKKKFNNQIEKNNNSLRVTN